VRRRMALSSLVHSLQKKCRNLKRFLLTEAHPSTYLLVNSLFFAECSAWTWLNCFFRSFLYFLCGRGRLGALCVARHLAVKILLLPEICRIGPDNALDALQEVQQSQTLRKGEILRLL
jgi:hypothetical protein